MPFQTEILDSLRRRDGKILEPVYLEMSVSGVCNFSCLQCHQLHHIAIESQNKWGMGPQVLDVTVAIETLRDAARLNTKFVELCGRGEPCLHPQLPDIIETIKSLGMKGSLVTNGSRLTNEIIESLAASQFDVVYISIYGTTQATFEGVARPHRQSDLWSIVDRVTAARRRAKNTRFVATICFQQCHADDIGALRSLIDALPVDDIEFTVMRPYQDKSIVQISNSRNSYNNEIGSQFKALLQASIALPKSLQTFIQRNVESGEIDTITSTYSHIPCYAGRWATFICDDSTVRPCSNSSWIMGNLKQNSLYEIWHGGEYTKFRQAAAQEMMKSRTSLHRSYCTHCGWAHIQEQIHKATSGLQGWRSSKE